MSTLAAAAAALAAAREIYVVLLPMIIYCFVFPEGQCHLGRGGGLPLNQSAWYRHFTALYKDDKNKDDLATI